jgi:hypothetical protein
MKYVRGQFIVIYINIYLLSACLQRGGAKLHRCQITATP